MSGPASSALAKANTQSRWGAPPNPGRRARLRALWPDVWALVGPRKWILLTGMILITISRLVAMAPPLATRALIDDVFGKGHRDMLPKLVALVVGASLVQNLITYTMTQLFSRSTTRLIGELRCKLEAHVMRLALGYHDGNKSGALGSRIMNDVQGLQNLVGTGLLGFVGSVMTSAIALSIMGRFSLLMTGAVVVGIGLLGSAIVLRTRKVREIAVERTKIYAEISGRLIETLGGVRVIKTYRAEEREALAFSTGIGRLIDNLLQTVTLNSRLGFGMGLLSGGVGAVIMYLGGTGVLDHRLTIGGFVTFTVLLGYAISPLQQIISIGNTVMEALAGLERTRDIFQEQPEDRDPHRTVAIGPLRGEVVFEDVRFAYNRGKSVIEGISFRADPGTVTAFVGPSGSGKSTTIGLIASFYSPTAGRILVDGLDLTTLRLDTYRSQLGVVLQETFLFAGSILDNVAFARPHATREEILAACRSARVDEFADKLPDGYDTIVGERGVMLSGGQRQRISIARALLADPRILILDEATSSLDTHSEALIQEALSHLLKGRTTFVIAHRLSTIRRADQILVVEEGRIREEGRHEDLCARRGLYFDMYTKQHELEANLFLAPGEGAAPAPAPRPALGAVGVGGAGGEEESIPLQLPPVLG